MRSVPIFFNDYQHALVYAGESSSGLSGFGAWFVLKREDGEWVTVSEHCFWISPCGDECPLTMSALCILWEIRRPYWLLMKLFLHLSVVLSCVHTLSSNVGGVI